MPPLRGNRGGQDRDYNDPISRGGGRGGRGRGARDDFGRGGSRQRRSNDEEGIMRVAGSSEMPSTAGAIAWRAREGRPIIIEAAGPSCLNIVAKALCICRSMLVDDRIDIKCTPEFYSPEDADDGNALNTVVRIYIDTEKAKAPQTRTGSLVRATPNSDARKVAGALAVNVRRNEPCAVSAGGRISINVAIKALAITRSYLEEDGLDITFQPCFPFAESSEVHFVVHRTRRGN